MDLITAIGLLSAMVTFEEAGRSWLQVIKDKIKKDEINLDKWNSEEPIVQRSLDKFKTQMTEKYNDYIFSEKEVDDIISGFFSQDAILFTDTEEKKELISIFKDIFSTYNEYTRSRMSSGERTLHKTIVVSKSKIMEKIASIEEQPRRENIKNFLHAVENSKEIELQNIEERINGEYEIDRSELLEKIQFDRERMISIQGNAGSGKSALCKKLLEGKEYILVTRAENLYSRRNINELWNCDIEDVILWLNNKLLYIFIDAIEFIADCGSNPFSMLQELYRLAEKYSNVRVITSCRSNDSSAFIKINSRHKIKLYEVSDLSKPEIDQIARHYPIISSLQNNEKYADLLISPFYINLILSGGFESENINDENEFRKIIWERIICLKDRCRKYNVLQSDIRKTIENVVFERAKNFSIGVDSDFISSDILEALHSEGIIVESAGKVRLKYDIFEDICFERFIDKKFDACNGEYNKFFSEIEKIGRCIYRRYQIWISNKLFVHDSREKFIYNLLLSDVLDMNWKKQTEIGIVKSKYCGLFFEEFYELLDEELIKELIDITNLYAFKAKINHVPLVMRTSPVGAARKYLIKLVSDEKINFEQNRDSIIKLCADYANSVSRIDDIDKNACDIIISFIENMMEDGDTEKSFCKYDEIVQLFLIVIKMTGASKEWVKKFIEERIEEYNLGDSRNRKVSEKILEAIVKNCTDSFAMELPELACKSAETLWLKRKVTEKFPFTEHDFDNVGLFGLSNNASYHMNSHNGIYNNAFIWLVLKYNFVIGLDWSISFINMAIQTLAEEKPDSVEQIVIYFPAENNKKEYWGNGYLWMGDIMEHNLPIVLTDIIHAIKRTLINTINNSDDTLYIKALSEYVWKSIYEKSNNILILSIIESIGMNFQKQLPGFALELASSIELIYYDIHRSAEYISNPTRELLEKQIMLSIGVPNIQARYEKDEKCGCSLQQYFSKTYLCGDEEIKTKCNAILNFLYSVFDDKKYPNENLQIQKMDFREPVVKELDEKTIIIEPQIKGTAKKFIEDNEAANEPSERLMESLNLLISNINEKKASAIQVISEFEKLCDMMKKDSLIEIKFENMLVLIMASALLLPDLNDDQRNEIVEEWLNRLEKVIQNQSYVAEVGLEIALWEQLNQNIKYDLKNRILKLMLAIIIDANHIGLITKMSDFVVLFLSRNENYARRFFNTIIMLAEDEMNHQKFNAMHLTNIYKDDDFEFIPNMVPKLRGDAFLISEEQNSRYKSEENQIIKEYLYDAKELIITEFDINNYDMNFLCNIGKCGLNIYDTPFRNVIKSIIRCMILIWHDSNGKTCVHEIIDLYQENKISTYFERELNIIGNDSKLVYDILFNEIDYSLFIKDTIDFYEDSLSFFLSAYVDGYREEGKRTDIEKKIRILETYINNIPEAFVKNELVKRLFLCAGRFTRWDADKVKTEYSFKDKHFLNAQISKYGFNYLKDVLYTIYLLKIDEILPDILISVGECFKTSIDDNKEQFARDIKESQVVVDMLILKSFIFFSDAIKKDASLIKAYEEILISLTEIRNEKAAVLLDEFRIH